jgi:hypothetical protein
MKGERRKKIPARYNRAERRRMLSWWLLFNLGIPLVLLGIILYFLLGGK